MLEDLGVPQFMLKEQVCFLMNNTTCRDSATLALKGLRLKALFSDHL